jgi:hypothetical protein
MAMKDVPDFGKLLVRMPYYSGAQTYCLQWQDKQAVAIVHPASRLLVISSDYGFWCHRWDDESMYDESMFLGFLIGCEADHLACLCLTEDQRREADVEATMRDIKAAICRERRRLRTTQTEARAAWTELVEWWDIEAWLEYRDEEVPPQIVRALPRSVYSYAHYKSSEVLLAFRTIWKEVRHLLQESYTRLYGKYVSCPTTCSVSRRS